MYDLNPRDKANNDHVGLLCAYIHRVCPVKSSAGNSCSADLNLAEDEKASQTLGMLLDCVSVKHLRVTMSSQPLILILLCSVLQAYQVLKHGGVKEENIIVMVQDDIAHNYMNPHPGKVFNKPNGPNVYEDVPLVRSLGVNFSALVSWPQRSDMGLMLLCWIVGLHW